VNTNSNDFSPHLLSPRRCHSSQPRFSAVEVIYLGLNSVMKGRPTKDEADNKNKAAFDREKGSALHAAFPPAARSTDDPTPPEITRTNNLTLLAMCNVLDLLDFTILPGMARALQQEFNAKLSDIGTLYLLQSLIGCVAMPIWGTLGDRMPRKVVLAGASLLWGFFTIGCAAANSMNHFMVYRTLAASFLFSVSPMMQSCVADMVPSERRGELFGKLAFVGSFGTLLGQFVSTSISEKIIFGVIHGWRLCLLFVGIVSVGFSIVMALYFEEPRRNRQEPIVETAVSEGRGRGAAASGGGDSWLLKQQQSIDWKSLKLPTFWLLVLQGIFGTIPWRAFGMFAIIWLEMIGYTPFQVAVVFSFGTCAASLGHLASGYIGDWAHSKVPYSGRIYVAQFSVMSGLVMVYTLLTIVPDSHDDEAAGDDGGNQKKDTLFLTVSIILFRLLAGWASNGTNRPIIADIAPPWSRASMYSYFCAMENIPSSFAGYLVSYLAENWFGFHSPKEQTLAPTDDTSSSSNNSQNQVTATTKNVQALTMALLLMTILPWALTVLFYGLMHYTYRKDMLVTESRVRENRDNSKYIRQQIQQAHQQKQSSTVISRRMKDFARNQTTVVTSPAEVESLLADEDIEE